MLNHLARSQAGIAFGSVCVFDQDDRVAKRQRPASGCVYTELGVHTADDQIRYGARLQRSFKLRA